MDADRERDSSSSRAGMTRGGATFISVYRKFEKPLFNFFYRMSLDADACEDLLQETFIRAYRNLHKFDASSGFPSYLYTIARNVFLDRLEKVRKRRETPLERVSERTRAATAARTSSAVGAGRLIASSYWRRTASSNPC